MVFFFETEDAIKTKYVLYMGKDKMENEELIKCAFKDDVWFHVDDMSSAHVYLRLWQGFDKGAPALADIPAELIADCAQLTKDNSIDGRKLAQVSISYTFAANLLKTPSMEAGAVAFHDEKAVKHVRIDKDRIIVNRLVKTKTERKVDELRAARRSGRKTKSRGHARRRRNRSWKISA